MKIKNHSVRRAVYGFAALALAVAALVPGLRAQVSAAQVTTRSIEMSSSTAGATGTTYLVTFTPATTATLKSIVVDFCDESPIVGDATCTKPTGFSVGAPTATTSISGTWTAAQANSNRTLTLTNSTGTSVPAATPVTITLTTATNPNTDNHSFYARILTYVNDSGANSAATYAAGSEGTYNDYGGIAMSTGKVINITARVMETLAFCVYKTTCTDDPSLTLGAGTPQVIDANAVYTGTAKFSISTNAQSGADVRFKGDTLKSGSNDIDAKGATAGAITAGTESFGFYLSTLGTNVTATAPYSSTASNYALDTGGSGITSTYGQAFAALSGPTNSSVTTLTFGTTASNTTAAGIYTAAEQLIATGKF